MANLSMREKVLILGAVVFGALALGYVYVWEPLAEQRARSLADIDSAERAATRLAAYEGTPLPVRAGPQETLGAVIASSARGRRIAISRLEPEGGIVRVSIADVAFDALLGWLADLKSDHSAQVASIEIERLTEPGIVTTRLTLRR